ncbi:ABC transporter permease [Streptomyces sp. S3(2020)]|uniref:ABC transporter permease n=1 Tax=Streptomyces sp. S3(2020) TaxID=2732044 RepID=UPI001488719C|nr:FtsX-like permease family protein [Streptomyces sp. S3(2020)]NNN35190.1 ABC transporter permease [Streptomyces sp. S3(2020)]
MRQWTRDLGMGVRFAFAGGREGWIRVLLTAVGVGLGVALLLLTTAIPNAMATREKREQARSDMSFSANPPKKADDTVIVGYVTTTYHDKNVRGRELEPEGSRSPLPPGVSAFPAAGEMVVSPALKELLDSDDGKALRERLPDRIVGTIGESGLIGSAELAFYRGAEGLAPQINGTYVDRIKRFGTPEQDQTSDPLDPVLLLLILVVFAVLLTPVAVFIAAAVRFGGERRDRRLAALRLVGSDARMTRRVAAGEAMAGAMVGLVLGAGFFMIGRQIAGSVEVFDYSFFPSYLNPSPLLALLVAVAVPAAAVLVTQLALRGVVIEPLGVVRTAKPARRRLWWRLLLPLGGLAMLYPMIGQGRDGGNFNQYLTVGGVLLLLVGVTALLPWGVEAVVSRLGAGPVAWQLAVRRLQLSSGTAARMVNGIAVAVAGAIALQMLFAGVDSQYTERKADDTAGSQIAISMASGSSIPAAKERFTTTRGVEQVYDIADGYLTESRGGGENYAPVSAGSCASLRKVAKLPSCRDGDVFVLKNGDYSYDTREMVKAGNQLWFEDSDDDKTTKPLAWTVPKDLQVVQSTEDSTRVGRAGLLMTPAALPSGADRMLTPELYLKLDTAVPDALEYVRNTAAEMNPYEEPITFASSLRDENYAAIRGGLFIGATCVLMLIGASLLVSQLEQLRERKKLLSALIAFGTKRSTLSLSVLWQTAIPVGLGLVLASSVGLTLGTVLLKMTDTPVSVDWASVLSMTGAGAAVVLVVTLLSLPPLLRLMRPDGLRTE